MADQQKTKGNPKARRSARKKAYYGRQYMRTARNTRARRARHEARHPNDQEARANWAERGIATDKAK